jgi:ABC-type nitrate/sulfonate/bicarbonate transport system substrate-binding protein
MTSEVIANMIRPRVTAVPCIAGMIAVVALCSILAWSRVEAQSLKKLDVNVFPAGFILPLWVAQDKGFFARNGLQVRLIATPNSVQQMTGLIDGGFDIAMTAVDNIIAYMEGQGEAPSRSTPDIVALMGSSGFLSLISAPEIKSLADLRGTTLSVDAMTTGYAFTLRRMLEKAGLKDGDYTLTSVGGMKERYEALLERKQAGSLLVPPFTLAALDRQFNELTTALALLGHFQGGVAAARRAWAAEHRDELIGFIRGNVAALDWLYDANNKSEALQIFQAHLPGTSAAVADKSYGVLLHPSSGFPRKAEIDVEGVRTVMEIRSQYAEPRKTLIDPSRYYDLTYYRAALSN